MFPIQTYTWSFILILLFLMEFTLSLDKGWNILPQNYIINGNFSTPDVPAVSVNSIQSIPGWSCTSICETINCINANSYWIAAISQPYVNCMGQVIDLDSMNHYETITQITAKTLKSDKYLLTFHYNIPQIKANQKTLLVYFNHQLILNIRPQISYNLLSYSAEQVVQGLEGFNNLTMTMIGLNPADGNGFKINNISLRLLVQIQVVELINSSIINPIFATVIGVPAARVVFGEILNVFINFERLQFYFYHDRVYSRNYLHFLTSINDLMNLKGVLVSKWLNKLVSKEINYLESLNFKYRYTSPDYLDKNSAGMGFIINNLTFVVIAIPFIFSFQIFCSLIFLLAFRHPVSRLLRKFSFLGLMVICFCQGNVEQFTFYFFAELKNYFSLTLQHKIINLFILLFFAFILLCSVAAYLFFKFHYRQKVKYFLENCKDRKMGLWALSVDKGMMSFLFGAVHQTMLSVPLQQMCALAFLELLWLLSKVSLLSLQVYRKKITVLISLLSGFMRIIFQISCLLYDRMPHGHVFLNTKVHQFVICVFLLVWSFEFLVNTCQFCYEMYLQFIFIVQYNFRQGDRKSQREVRKDKTSDKAQTIAGIKIVIPIKDAYMCQLPDKTRRIRAIMLFKNQRFLRFSRSEPYESGL